MENNNMENNKEELVQEGLGALQKKFLIIGKTHIKAWHAWLVLGIVVGLVVGVLFVVNNGGFERSMAAVRPSKITVLSPNGGEVWPVGSVQTITWSSKNAPTVMVDLIRPGYECHLTNGDVANTGSLTFTVFDCVGGLSITPATDYKIRVMYRVNASIVTSDESNAPFSIE